MESPNSEAASVTELFLKLSTDTDPEVRDWATFGLGQSEINTIELRDALAARLDDDDEDTRDEAMVGLANLKDERVFPAILQELSLRSVRTKAIEAAGIMPDKAFLPMLEELLAANPDDLEIIDATNACRAGTPIDTTAWLLRRSQT